MKKTIHLVQVNDIIGTNVVLPLAVGLLWQNAIDNPVVFDNWQLGQVVYKKEDVDTVAKRLSNGNLICFSNYVWNTEYHLALASAIKKLNPQIFIVVGGPDVSPEKRNFWKEHGDIFDLAIVGEGEQSLTKLLKNFPSINEDDIPGAWSKNKFTSESPRIQHLPYQNSPYLNGFFNDIVEREHSAGMTIQAVVQTNRGCPYRCTFCEEGREYKNKMYFYDEQRIRDELEWCATHRVEYLNIADDNWGITQQDVEYFRWIRDLKLKHGYPDVIDATYAKNAPDRLLQLADIDAEYNTRLIRGFTIALQSLNADTLKSIKRFNLVPHKQQKLINGLKNRNMPTYTEIIWPLPYEDYKTFIDGLDNVIESGLDNWMGVYPLVLQEGTELYEEFAQDYEFVKQQSHNDNKRNQQHVAFTNAVNASTWVDTDTIIQGQLLYAWLICLFFFGYGRQALLDLKVQKDKTVCTLVNEFIEFVMRNPDLEVYKFNQRIRQWWSEYYAGNTVPDISLFPDQDTSNWSPYGHLASYLQQNLDQFYKEFDLFLNGQVGAEKNRHGVVRYKQNYPCQAKSLTVDVVNPVPDFDSLYEFCRYFYWWKRKNGWHRTIINER